MGSWFSRTISFLEAEKKTWIEHSLTYDHEVRHANLAMIDCFEDGKPIYLSSLTSSFGGVSFEHWFMTDRTHYLEFGGIDFDIYKARVTFNTNVRHGYSLQKFKTMNEAVRNRIRHVLGMCNYSLCLRNCEHVANYVFAGTWFSGQMGEMGTLMDTFQNYMLGNQKRKVNSFPHSIRPHVFEDGPRIYSFTSGHYTATHFDYYLDSEEPDTYNVLVVGPTGAGKSHLINVLFNKSICASEPSHQSVTRDIYFIRGKGPIYDLRRERVEEKKIIIADTVGLCDTEWDERNILKLIKGRIRANYRALHLVIIVFKAERLIAEYVRNIKNIMEWLKYKEGNNYLRFCFISTYGDGLNDSQKDRLRREAIQILGLKATGRVLRRDGSPFQSLQYVGFPPEETLNDLTRERVRQSWTVLRTVFESQGNTDVLNVNTEKCSIL